MQAAVYYFPNYHVDERNERIHGKNWTEWDVMRKATPRFPGHDQPKIPVWGFEDESQPEVMEKKIAAAADAGINAFVFDWYWYDGPFLEKALTHGFLQAANRTRLKFALMWANHDWTNIHPGNRETKKYPLDFAWTTQRESIGFVWDRIIEKFMCRPEYWRVNDLPYFSIYAVNRFINQMGGVQAAADVIADFRERVKRAGLPGVHLNGIWYDVLDSNPICSACPQKDWVEKIGFDSYTSYNLTGIAPEWRTEFPRVPYEKLTDDYLASADHAMRTLPGAYFPVVTVGWDSSPRCVQSEMFDSQPGYPWLPVMEPNGRNFGDAVAKTLALLKKQPKSKQIMFINAWNEWTEGSYLEPDQKNGMDFLNVLKKQLSTEK